MFTSLIIMWSCITVFPVNALYVCQCIVNEYTVFVICVLLTLYMSTDHVAIHGRIMLYCCIEFFENKEIKIFKGLAF